MFLWNYLAFPKPWITSRFGCVFHINQCARNVGLILTILLKYSFSWISFPRSLTSINLNVKSNLVREFKFAKLDIFLKINHTQVPYANMTSWSYDTLDKYIWLCMVGTMNLIFMIGFQMKKIKGKFNMVCNSSWDISSENFVNRIFVKISFSKNKVPSSFQNFSSCKNSSFCKV